MDSIAVAAFLISNILSMILGIRIGYNAGALSAAQNIKGTLTEVLNKVSKETRDELNKVSFQIKMDKLAKDMEEKL